MKNLLFNVKWIGKNCRFIFPYVFLIIFISSLFSSISVYQALLAKNIIDSALNRNIIELKNFILIFLIIHLCSFVISPSITFLNSYTSNKLSNKLQSNTFAHFIRSKYSEQEKYHSMDIINRINNDISNITTLIVNILPEAISTLFLLISSFFVLYSINKFYALLSIILFPIFLLISKVYGKKQKYLYKEVQQKEVQCNSFLQESISSTIILKTFCREEIANNNLKKLQRDKFKSILKRTKLNIITNSLINVGMNTGYLIIYIIGALSIGYGTLTVGSFTALIQLFQKVQGPIYYLSSIFSQIISALGASERLQEIYKLPLDTLDITLLDKESFNELQFKDVSFAYKKNDYILNKINLKIYPGDSLGIIGDSGKGKTTLLKLILSLLDPTKGKILLDNVPINPSHRTIMSYVPQGNTLSSGTIKENLIYGNKNISNLEIYDALKISCAYEFICNLPKGLDTIIGEKALGLSEGQAQRLSITRAILQKKPILILDEATSALDVSTELRLLENLNNIKHKPTVIVVTHRPAALKYCNKTLKIPSETTSYNKGVTLNLL